jgi:hypothetical protein
MLDMTRRTSRVHPARARQSSLGVNSSIVGRSIIHDVGALCSPSNIRSSTSSVKLLLRALRADRHPNVPARSVCASSHSNVHAMSWT